MLFAYEIRDHNGVLKKNLIEAEKKTCYPKSELTFKLIALQHYADLNDKWVPYRHSQPRESPPELVIPDAVPRDERIWVPVEDNVWFRPLLLSGSLLTQSKPKSIRREKSNS